MGKIEEALGIRNFLAKTALILIGLYFTIGTGHKHVMDLCNDLEWDVSDTYMMGSGFFLAAGAAVYDALLDAAISKFRGGKKQNDAA